MDAVTLGRLVTVDEVVERSLRLELLHEAFDLLALQELRVEVVRFCHVEVIADFLDALGLKHAPIERDDVTVLFVFLFLEVVDDHDSWRCILNAYLDWDRWRQRAADGHFCQVDVLRFALFG